MKMAQALVKLGHQVRLVVPLHGTAIESHSWEYLAHTYGLIGDRFPIAWLPVNPSLRSYDFGLKATRWAKHWGAELLYTRHPQAAALGSILSIATILEIHDVPQGIAGPWLFRCFLQGKGARRLVVITHFLADDLCQRFHLGLLDELDSAFMVIAPDGVDLDRYTDLPAPVKARQALTSNLAVMDKQSLSGDKFSPETFTVGYTGHLYPGRGSDLLLALAARLPDMTFLLVGGDPQVVFDLRQRAEGMGLHNLILTGFVPNAELPIYQAACEVLLMPYQTQVAASSGGDIGRYLSPMKLFEYLACGRAILASDLSVLQEILNPQNAVILPRDDLDAWVEALINLRDDIPRRMALGAQARQDAEMYTWEKRASRILDGF
jgi:glycosyltransferase involved in cell wall biosynthesis